MFYYMCVCYSGAYEWAQKTLKDHAKDKRPYLYTREQLEKAKTHDKLWNGAQVPSYSNVFDVTFARQSVLFLTAVYFMLSPLVPDGH